MSFPNLRCGSHKNMLTGYVTQLQYIKTKVKSINGNFTKMYVIVYVSLSNWLIYGSGIIYKVIVLS